MATILSLPDDCILQIIYSLRPGQLISAYNLRALFATCKGINGVMVARRRDIVEYFTTITMYRNTTYYRLAGLLHRDNDLPAMIIVNGYRNYYTTLHETVHHWYQHGKRHRDNGPAIIRDNGINVWSQWWTHNVFDREIVTPRCDF